MSQRSKTKSYKICVTGKDSDQPVCDRQRLRSACTSTQGFLFTPFWIVWGLQKSYAISEDSDQTARMRSLI